MGAVVVVLGEVDFTIFNYWGFLLDCLSQGWLGLGWGGRETHIPLCIRWNVAEDNAETGYITGGAVS